MCCEIPEILDVVACDNSTFFTALFAVVTSSNPPNNYSAGYFEKILEVFFRTKTLPLMKYVNEAGHSLFLHFLNHIRNYSIMQIVQRLLLPHIPFYPDSVAEKLNEKEIEQSQCQWSYQFETSQALINTLINSDNSDAIVHIADLLITVIQLSPADAPILKYLCDSTIVSMFWNSIQTWDALSQSETLIISVVSVLECILSRLYETAAALVFDSSGSNALLSSIKQSFQNLLVGVEATLPILKSSITCSLQDRVIDGTKKEVKAKRLGQLNFFFAKLIEGLLRLGDDEVDASLIQSGLMKAIVDLIFCYKFHSMLHLSIQRIILVILDDFAHRRNICHAIFIEYKFIDRLQDTLQEALSIPIGNRSPLVGHLIIIAQV